MALASTYSIIIVSGFEFRWSEALLGLREVRCIDFRFMRIGRKKFINNNLVRSTNIFAYTSKVGYCATTHVNLLV
jgi:hypothetical protein